MKKVKVDDVYLLDSKNNYLDIIFKYRKFLSDEFANFSNRFSVEECTSRIKALNSVENKLETYMNKTKEKGKIPLIKCLNDLFGIRFILKNTTISIDEIKDIIIEHYPETLHKKHRVVLSSKNGYNAVHVYLHEDNTYFPWEVQVWRKSDETANKDSHRQHKQAYINWEEQSL